MYLNEQSERKKMMKKRLSVEKAMFERRREHKKVLCFLSLLFFGMNELHK
jgi:hypothetical protein